MAAAIGFRGYASGLTVYAIVRRYDDVVKVWNRSTLAWEDYDEDNFAHYVFLGSEHGSSRFYSTNIDEITDRSRSGGVVSWFEQSGASPNAEDDLVIATGDFRPIYQRKHRSLLNPPPAPSAKAYVTPAEA